MIFHGSRAPKLGTLPINGTKCSYCQKYETQHVSVFGKYKHIYWIPFFPLGKEVLSECSHCKRTIKKKEFSRQLKDAYELNKGQIKRPFWHWSGLALVALLAGFIIMPSKANNDLDPRKALLKADINQMTRFPVKETDSISYNLKSMFTVSTSDMVNTEDFEFYSRLKDDKALILVKIPVLKKIKKESRQIFMDVVQLHLLTEPVLKGKYVYVGIHGRSNFMLVKTPSVSKSSFFVSEETLYEFYGKNSRINKTEIDDWSQINANEIYGLPKKDLKLKKEQYFTVANLNENDVNYRKGKAKFKLFLENENENAAVFLNFDFRKNRVYFNEKDIEYRGSLVRLLAE